MSCESYCLTFDCNVCASVRVSGPRTRKSPRLLVKMGLPSIGVCRCLSARKRDPSEKGKCNADCRAEDASANPVCLAIKTPKKVVASPAAGLSREIVRNELSQARSGLKATKAARSRSKCAECPSCETGNSNYSDEPAERSMAQSETDAENAGDSGKMANGQGLRVRTPSTSQST